jgi:hypothetical protein
MVGARRLARPRLPDPKSGGSAIPREPRAGRKWMNEWMMDYWIVGQAAGAFPLIQQSIDPSLWCSPANMCASISRVFGLSR